MIKPSILIEVKNGKPVCSVVSTDADDVLNAYKSSKVEAYAFVRPVPAKRKNALKGGGELPEPVKALKKAKPRK